MKINPLDAHDRLKHFTKQKFDISDCCQDLINKRPFGQYPFYIFAHARTDDNGVDKRLIWQPRLTRPKPQTNSMLFKAYPGSDIIKVIWMLPSRELWSQFEKGMLMENQTIYESIDMFQNHREKMELKEDDDLSDDKIDAIYKELSLDARYHKHMNKLYSS